MKVYNVSGTVTCQFWMTANDDLIQNWMTATLDDLEVSVSDIRIRRYPDRPDLKQATAFVATLLWANSPDDALDRVDSLLGRKQMLLQDPHIIESEEVPESWVK